MFKPILMNVDKKINLQPKSREEKMNGWFIKNWFFFLLLKILNKLLLKFYLNKYWFT